MKTFLEFFSLFVFVVVMYAGHTASWAMAVLALMYVIFGIYSWLDGQAVAHGRNLEVMEQFTEGLDRED